ncbi:MAG: tRNA (adenosine(37)-N6)-dimethylallyltransferase MiaA [Desulfuromonas sp.]|nr:tRNA (adenosine(37)-N6)-dimethylallyltransferase MiaA [Desulfuromonas sp.]
MSPAHAQRLPPLTVLCGPTAAGKTAAALALAEHFDLEVVSADSRQVYRLMDVGTAKPSSEERARVPHHLLDVVWPDEPFDVARFVALATEAIDGILARGRLPLLVGGTGLYVRALTEGLAEAPGADPLLRRRLEAQAEAEGNAALHRRLAAVDPAAAGQLHPNDRVRIVRALEVFELTGRPLSSWQQAHGFRARNYRLLKIALSPPRSELYRRIDDRAAAMLQGGLVEEAERLLQAGYDPRLKALQTIGYREAIRLLEGKVSREAALVELQQATRRYAKRQLTWFRADSEMIWVDSAKDSDKIQTLMAQFHAV